MKQQNQDRDNSAGHSDDYPQLHEQLSAFLLQQEQLNPIDKKKLYTTFADLCLQMLAENASWDETAAAQKLTAFIHPEIKKKLSRCKKANACPYREQAPLFSENIQTASC